MMKTRLIRGTVSVLFFLTTMSCTWDQAEPQVDCSVSPVEIDVLESVATECGAAIGSFRVNAAGGEPPYVYTSEAGTNADGVFSSLEAGNYVVVATDAKGCASEVTIPIQNLEGVNLQEIVVEESGCGSTEGKIEVVASGGVEPYLYSINEGQPQTGRTFSGLTRGTYTVKIADQLGCEIVESVEVLAGVSYENSVKNIIENSCAVSGCHNGSISPDLRSFSTIQARASSIKARTASGSMPRGSTLTQAQKDAIACWVDDGALQN
ncbi:hypothetical protein [uncultured Imperialibacter sp.]|mgnify:FL=1|uniref:hypothetical protein n=1 Tax=uncultured Imperialibacter sp. TaxID=1672639 RepID=UPI0030D8C9EA